MESNDKVPPTELDVNVRSAIARIDEKTFTDRTSGHVFRRYKYFDFEVIQDIETGFINAGKFVRDIARLAGKRREINDFRKTNDFSIAIEITRGIIKKTEPPENPVGLTNTEIEAYMMRHYNEGIWRLR